MAAYKGTTVADFPNMFFIVGPNSGSDTQSMVFMIESQVDLHRRRRPDHARSRLRHVWR